MNKTIHIPYGRRHDYIGECASFRAINTVTSYPIASITKVFTATAIFLLIQDGKMRPDEPIATILTHLPESWKHVSVLNCLSHTSGIPDVPNIYDTFGEYPLSEEAALASAASCPLVYETGEKSAYNQTEFILLKRAIEKVSGLSYAEFIQQRILLPLGISSALFGDSREVIPHSVTVYTRAFPATDRLHPRPRPIEPFANKLTILCSIPCSFSPTTPMRAMD